MMSTYDDPANDPGVKGLMNIVMKGLTFQGFDITEDFTEHKYKIAHQQTIIRYLREGSWKVLNNVFPGIHSAPKGYTSLYTGENFGKVILKIAGFS